MKHFIGYYNYTVVPTYIGLAFAVLGIFFAINGNIAMAVKCLLVSGLFDMFDGKIAATRKRTDDEKQFGIQIDSLCDLISFGVLPAIIGYCACGWSWHMAAIAIIYILAAITRLAYFNVDELKRQSEESGARKYYEGLPVTSAALIFPIIFAFSELMGAAFPTVYEAVMAAVAVAFLARIKIKKPGTVGLAFLLVIGTLTIVSIMLFR